MNLAHAVGAAHGRDNHAQIAQSAPKRSMVNRGHGPLLQRITHLNIFKLIAALLLGSCVFVQNVNAQTAPSKKAATMSMREALYLVPIGTMPDGTLDALQRYVESRFNVPTQITPRVSLHRDFIDYQRGVQAVGEKLIQRVQGLYPLKSGEQKPLYLAITGSDIFSAENPQWLHVLALRVPNGNYALVSSARLDESFYAREANPKLLQERLKKIVARQVAILLMGSKTNDDPTSALFANLKGVEDLDKVTKDF